MQASKAFWNGITSATFIILNVWSKLQLFTSLERVLSQKLLLNACPEWLWGFSRFHHKETQHLEQREQSIHHPLTSCWCSWTGSPWDPGRPPQKALRKQRLVSHQAFYTERLIQPSHPLLAPSLPTLLKAACSLQYGYLSHSLCTRVNTVFQNFWAPKVGRSPGLRAWLFPCECNAVFLWSIPPLMISTPRQSDLQANPQRYKTPALVTDSTKYFGLYIFYSQLLSQPAPPALLRRPPQPLQHPGIQDIIVPCCVWPSPLRTQHLPTVTLQMYVQMFPISTIGNNGGVPGTNIRSWLGNDLMVPIVTEKVKKLLKAVGEVLSQSEDSWLSWTKGHLTGIRFMVSTDSPTNSSMRASTSHQRQSRSWHPLVGNSTATAGTLIPCPKKAAQMVRGSCATSQWHPELHTDLEEMQKALKHKCCHCSPAICRLQKKGADREGCAGRAGCRMWRRRLNFLLSQHTDSRHWNTCKEHNKAIPTTLLTMIVSLGPGGRSLAVFKKEPSLHSDLPRWRGSSFGFSRKATKKQLWKVIVQEWVGGLEQR